MNPNPSSTKGLLSKTVCEVCKKELSKVHIVWECKALHTTCQGCVVERLSVDGEVMKCPRCAKKLTLIKPEATQAEHVYIYVDDSNMWIEAKKLASKQLRLRTQEDPRVRFDIGKVTDVVARGREIAMGTLYGSEPPHIDTVWKKIKESGWKVSTSQRSAITKRQKQVDHRMVADITELVSDSGVTKGTIILVSGDGDMVPAIEAGLKKKWSFEIWMWSSGISSCIYKLKDDNPGQVSIFPLNMHLGDITFTNFKFNMKKFAPHLKSQSAVIRDVDFDPTDSWERHLSQQLRWPFQFCWIGEKSTNPLEYRDIILVFASVKSTVDDKNAKDNFDKIFSQLKVEYPDKVVSYPGYQQKFHRKEELSISNRFEKLYRVDSQLSATSSGDSSDEPVMETGSGAHSKERKSGSSECSGYYSCDPAEPTYSRTSENGSSGASCPLSRGTSQSSLYDPTWDASSESNADDNTGPFLTVVHQKQRRPTQQFSTPCLYRSRCVFGTRCRFHHTDAEKRFFENPYKDRECRFKNGCRKGSARCAFAHSSTEGFCRWCHQWGHLQANCSVKPDRK